MTETKSWDDLHQEGMGPTQVVDFLRAPTDIEDGVRARTARAGLIGKEDRKYHVLLGERALRTNIGGSAVMRAQLRHVLDSFELPGVTLGIIPSRAPLSLYPGNSFGVFDDECVEIELYGPSSTCREDEQVVRYKRAFALLKQSAVYGDDAKALVRAELDAIEGRESGETG
ncbi:DUF5753 domain-containing protein [Streptomyces sp. CA-294286]|uniref:DUF5753 domain-containing protein n=1 Tax=Streptomyces sp. CA-294286 TaxID=3240070 RepID=UPI003D8D6A81